MIQRPVKSRTGVPEEHYPLDDIHPDFDLMVGKLKSYDYARCACGALAEITTCEGRLIERCQGCGTEKRA